MKDEIAVLGEGALEKKFYEACLFQHPIPWTFGEHFSNSISIPLGIFNAMVCLMGDILVLF